MKRKKMLDAFSNIDDHFIEEASLEKAKAILKEVKQEKRNKRKWIRYGLWATACSLIIALNLWLFIPYKVTPPSVSEFSSSQYYSVIQKINKAHFKKPKYKNNFQRLIRGGFLFMKADDAGPEMNESNQYVETTDNQVDGIIEADLIKRTTTHAFYLYMDTVSVYTLDKENSKLVTTYRIDVNASYVETTGEMFLSEDGKRLTVIFAYYSNEYRCFDVISLNVENPQNISEIGRITLNSAYMTSRLVNGDLLVVGSYTVYRGVDFNSEEEFIPSLIINDQQIFIDKEDIISPDTLSSTSYTVICKIDEKSLTVEDFTAFLSYTTAVYVSKDYVYVGRSFTDEHVKTNNTSLFISKTEIIPIGYTGEGLEVKKSVVVDGEISDQYSLDEFEGKLRVVTTTKQEESYTDYRSETKSDKINASLFVVDLTSMQVVASVQNFAPEGESVRSTRFDKNTVYVCTSIYVSDPVFFFDLTDLNNIEIKDTGTIAGFSTSLVNFGDGYLLGIGVGENGRDLKIEIYAEGENEVLSICNFQAEVGYSSSYKSYYINRQRGLIGLGVWSHSDGDLAYILLKFDSESLTLILDTPIRTDAYFARMVLIDDYAYVFGKEEIIVVKL